MMLVQWVVSQASVVTDIELADAVDQIVKLFAGTKGAGALAIAAGVVQALMLLLKTQLGKLTGAWQWTTVTALTCVAALLSAKIAGASWGAAVLAGPVVAAFQVFVHQGVTQWQQHVADKKPTGNPTPPDASAKKPS